MLSKFEFSIYISFLLIIVHSCNNQNNSDRLPSININNKDYNDNIVIDSYIDSVFFISATDEVPLISEISKLLFTDNQIIIHEQATLSNKAVFGIDFSGNLKNIYGAIGQGPNEYISSFDIACNKEFLFVYDRHKKHLLKYNLTSGELIDKVKLPFYMLQFMFIDNNNIAIFADEEDKNEFIIYDISKSSDIFGEYKYSEDNSIEIPKVFAKNVDNIYYLHPASDTIFTISNNNLIPQFTINYEDGAIDNEFREIKGFEAKSQYIKRNSISLTTEIFATDNFYMFRYLYRDKIRTFLTNKNKKVIFHGENFVYKNKILPKPIALWKDYLVFYIVPEIYEIGRMPKNDNFVFMFTKIKQK